MFERFMESNLVWGFRDIACYFREWKRLMQLEGNLPSGNECMQAKQAEHDFFTSLSLTMGCRYNNYDIWYEKYV
jgi:hypothetical protein